MKQFASFRLDTANECLWQDERQIALQPKPYAVLNYLVEHPGRLITHDELLDALWPETYVQPQILRTYMLELRKILGDSADEPRFIQTLPKRGYCFVAQVTEAISKSAAATSPGGKKPSVPLPAKLPSTLIGRDKELTRLCAELELVETGQRRIVFLSGEAGIGKTALTDTLAETWCSPAGPSPSILHARGQCVPGIGSREQLYPVLEALGHLCASPDGAAACSVLSRLAPECLALLGRQGAENPNGRHPASDHLQGNLCAALEELASVKPLVLIFEDMQWADESTLQLVSALARRRAPAKLMVVATSRPRSAASDHALKQLRQDLLMQRLATEIVVEPLPRAGMVALLAKELGQQAPPKLINFVHHHAEGNPLFAISIVQHLIAERLLLRSSNQPGSPWQLDASFETEAGVPRDLAQMLEIEIARLPEEDQRILEAGSLMNVAFPAWSAAAALNADLGDIEEACEKLARGAHFLERIGFDELPDGSRCPFYAFTHGIYREVLYQRQSDARRARRHTRIAERLGELFAGREAHVAREMALHFEAAGDFERGAQALRAAAQYAEQRHAHAEAAELAERADSLAAGKCKA